MTQDLTVGKPLLRVWQFAVPVLFGLLLQQVYSLVDTAIVGHALGVMALGGVGATGWRSRWRSHSVQVNTTSCAGMWRAAFGWGLSCLRCCWP